MDKSILLKGITWNHTRGYCPMVATGQRFSETHPKVNIEWSKRSLQQFADGHIGELAANYDLLVMDHPWAGFAAKAGIIIPLDKFMPASFLEDQAVNSVGKSYESYHFNGHQYALPIDAAAPVASSRPDLLDKMDLMVPDTFDGLLALAEKGFVAMPGIPIDTLMNFYMMCCALGEAPFQTGDNVVSEKVGIKALEMLKELTSKLDSEFFHWNPIDVYEAMTLRDNLIYCPFAYGYSNYSRNGYSLKPLHFHDIINIDIAGKTRSTLGGTGLAISANCKNVDTAVQYAMEVASAETQATLYFDSGGQPGHRRAWKDVHVNSMSCNFFKSTLRTLDNAFLRPRYYGYMHFQDRGGGVIRKYLMEGGRDMDVLSRLNGIYLESKRERAL